MFDNTSNNLSHPNSVQNHFIDTLVSLGYVDRKRLVGYENKSEKEIADFLANGICTKEQVARAYSAYFGLPFISIKGKTIDPNVLKLIPQEDVKRYKIVSYGLSEKNLQLGLADPTILQAQPPEVLKKLTTDGYNMSLSIISIDDVDYVSSLYSGVNPMDTNISNTIKQDVSDQTSSDSNFPFIDLLKLNIPREVLLKFPKEVAEKYRMVVFDTEPPINVTKASKKIKVALLDPNDTQSKEILDFIRKKNNIEMVKHKCDESGLAKALAGYLPVSTMLGEEKDLKKDVDKEDKNREDKEVKGDESKEKAGTELDDKKDHIKSKDEENKDKTELEKKKVDYLNVSKNDEKADEVKSVSEEDVNKVDISSEKKVDQMQTIASGVLKPEDQRVKEGITAPYSPPVTDQAKDTKVEFVPEIKAEDIDSKAGLESRAEINENLEENNLDKFLTRPVNTVEDLESVIKAGMVPEIVAGIVSLGIVLQISDIHIEAASENVRLRYRIDGILKDIIRMPLSLHAPLISRIKILSKLKIDEQRVPQDGRFDVIVRQHEIDLRVSTLPTVHGEKVVMRILDKSVGILTLEDMGITGVGFDILVKNIKKPYGIILATGPTGSGKSTTLYAVLQRISTTAVNVITLEDPVEYEISGINQTQVKPQIGFTFAEGLRSVLRQDPNIIMVGEIRDLETAAMATHAALTGHLVLSTLHTNDSSGALPRLINMGVEPFLITSSVNCIVAQRLVRKVCSKCKEKIELPPALIEEILEEISKIPDTKIASMKKDDLTFFHGKGCSECTNGYHGRIGIYEVLEMNEKIETLAVDKQPASAIAEQACKDGMITMKQDGILKALKGITTMDEVLRVTTSS